jgi:DNA-binding NarL/FixJ family response regulator
MGEPEVAEVVGARVMIVEDHELLAQSLSLALQAQGMDVDIVPLTTPDDVMLMAEKVTPDVVLLDLDLGGAIGSGLQFVEPLIAGGAQVLIVTGSNDLMRIAECVEVGAVGYVRKSQPFQELLDAVVEVASLQTLMTPRQRRSLLAELQDQRRADRGRLQLFNRLTGRERAVLHALQEGKSAEVMAAEWFVSTATVRSQIRSILRKLDVNSQLAAVAAARRAGWTYEKP